MTPEAWKKRALARINDFNLFRSISVNHDLVRATRLAWIEVALAVVRGAKSAAPNDELVTRVSALADEELRKARSLAFDRDADPGFSYIDAHVDALMNRVAEVVAPHGSQTAEQEVTRDFVTTFTAVIGWPPDELPPVFENVTKSGLVTKGGAPRAFGELVFAEFAELLKSPRKYPEAREAFYIAMDKLARDLAEQTFAALKGLDAKLDAALTGKDALTTLRAGIDEYLRLVSKIAEDMVRVEQKLDALPDAVAEKMVAAFEKTDEARRAESAGLERFALIALAKRITNVETLEQALIELDRAVEVAIKVQEEGARGSNAGEFVDEVLRRVAALSRKGLFDEAADEAGHAFLQWQTAEKERRAFAVQAGLKFLDAGIEQNTLRRDAKAVARLIAQKIDLDLDEMAHRFEAMSETQQEFYRRGRDKGLNFDLEVSTELARMMSLSAVNSEVRWGCLNNLGTALQELGAKESRNTHLEEALVAYSAALKEIPRERFPLAWAITKTNVGNTLQTLGSRESGTAHLWEAVAAYRAALEERTRELVPLDWAMTQNDLGGVLQELGSRESGTAHLEQAVVAYRAALLQFTRKRFPLDWAMTKSNLGNALMTLGQRKSGTNTLKKAVAAHRAALMEFTRERVPLYWATTQNNLGNALSALGERKSGTAGLEEAIVAYRAALEERPRARVPLDWATTQNNLGNALSALGERKSGTATLEEAVVAYRAALEERARDRVPFYWAQTRENMGLAFLSLFRRSGLGSYYTDALAAVDDALDVYSQAKAEYDIGTAEKLRADILAAKPDTP
jgi:tetratricopeptide (TPR) repeat protein